MTPADATTLQWIVIIAAQLPELVAIGASLVILLAVLRAVTS